MAELLRRIRLPPEIERYLDPVSFYFTTEFSETLCRSMWETGLRGFGNRVYFLFATSWLCGANKSVRRGGFMYEKMISNCWIVQCYDKRWKIKNTNIIRLQRVSILFPSSGGILFSRSFINFTLVEKIIFQIDGN